MVSRTKLTLIIFALLLSLLAFSAVNPATKIVIHSGTSEMELAQMQDDLEDDGYTLEITEITRDDSGKIISISGEVNFADNCSGSFSTDRLLGKILITYTPLNKMSIQVNKIF